ncbi:hypothetical protein Ahy_B01g053160 isoform A [Arachis hypogaea]|uniref:BZIP domain-containing protein n=1 Tax=Arachis hypogaea TaxID=3818 RepID=A0A445ARA6_ARAHY|nr:hypothetical protein Ahy_B01g053160 isoform A [Arachis hypogaea]
MTKTPSKFAIIHNFALNPSSINNGPLRCPGYANGCFSLWDCPDLFTCSRPTNSPKPVTSSSGSDEPNQPTDEPDRSLDEKPARPYRDMVIDERKRRRMLSNRESARRSRMRKQRHLENLRNQLNKCRVENRELNNRLQFIVHHLNRIRTENQWLRSERTVLWQKLSDFTQILVFQELHPLDHISNIPCMVAMQ